ncbi:MAG: VWA domain-containing protein [Gammaproteobacteria bacterium]|nr:VWA domain-containing protein [Gammaproteobacteria bacterium]
MKTRRRDIEGISLSFLDVISCGFGAIILLLVLVKVFDPIVFEESMKNLEGYLASLQQELVEIRGETTTLNRELIRKEDKQAEEMNRLSQLKADLAALQSKYETTRDKTRLNNTIEGRLAEAKQSLTEEMERLLADYQEQQENNTIGGIPVDSEYVIFIIDTSGSMREFAWPLVIQKVQETLAVYPRLKGIQVMNDQGDYMFSQYAGTWIRDTAARREAILDRMQSWNAFSNSSPEQGCHPGHLHFLPARSKNQPLCFRRRLQRPLDSRRRRCGGPNQPNRCLRRTPRSHPRYRLPRHLPGGAARRLRLQVRAPDAGTE